MNKSQLISAIAESAGISLTEAEKMLNSTLNSITDTLTKGDSVSLVGFGKFGTKIRSARKVKNPQSGKEIMLEAKAVPFFKAGKALKEQVDSQ